jgi:tetratricopeptide (TPR) repeat protein
MQSPNNSKSCTGATAGIQLKLSGSLAIAFVFIANLVFVPRAFAPLIAMAIPLDQIAQQSSVIIKAKAISSSPATDDWFQSYPGYKVYSTRMQVVSIIKGIPGSQQIEFHHYGTDKAVPQTSMEFVQVYEFKQDRSYIVFAANTAQDGVLRQLWKNPTVKSDQGVYLAADDTVVRVGRIADILFTEFTNLLANSVTEDVLYGIRQLDEMSNPLNRLLKLHDFGQSEVLGAISPLMSNGDEQIAKAAIQAIGGSNPYFRDEDAIFWLAKVGGRKLPGIGAWESDQNPGAHEYYRQLEEVADGKGSAELKSMAIRALGRSAHSDLVPAVLRWITSTEPRVREAATILSADFPAESVAGSITTSANDPDPRVRVAAARAIGFGQFADLLSVLAQSLHDESLDVRRAALMSLASFSPQKSRDILRANIDNPEFRSVFVNILASENPEPYLKALGEIIGDKQLFAPVSGKIPSAESWDILFRYLKTRTTQALQSGKFNPQFEVLEKAQFFDSSNPRDLYEFYLANGMKDRAANFREYIRRTSPFRMEDFFERVDLKYGIIPASTKISPAMVEELFLAQRYDDAIRVGKEYLALNPKDALVLANVGEAYFKLKQYGNAIDALEQAAALDSKLDAILYNLGLAYRLVGRYEDALIPLRKILDRDPQPEIRDEAWLEMFANLERLGRISEAAAETDKEVRLNPDSPYAFFARGDIRQVQNQLDDAVADFKQALALPATPDLKAQIYFGLSNTYMKMSRFPDVIEMANKALELAPETEGFEELLFNCQSLLAAAYGMSSRCDKAIDALEKAISLKPDDMGVYNNLSVCLKDSGHLQDAEKAVRYAVGLQPDRWEPRYNLSLVLLQERRFTEAESELRECLRLGARDWKVYLNFGRLQFQQKNLKEAASMYTQAHQLQPADPMIMNDLAYALSELNEKPEEALDLAQRAVRSNPASAAFRDTLGWAYFKIGKYPEAEKELLLASQSSPGHAEILEHLGYVYEKEGKTADAISNWKRALSLTSDEETKSRLQAKLGTR